MMMIAPSDIYSLSDFNRKAAEHIKRLQESKRPEVLTVNGKAAVVVQDAQAYEALIDMLETLEKIAKAAKDFDSGKGIPVTDAFSSLEERLAAKYPNAKL